MSRVCTICFHPDRAAIDAALVAGESYRHIASQHNVGYKSVERHVTGGHIAEEVKQSQAATEEGRGLDIVRQLRQINDVSRAILKEARDDSDNETALKAVDRIAKQLELQAKLLGTIDAPQVNVYLSPEWQDIRKALTMALLPFPDARVAVATALSQMEDARARLN